MGKKVKPGKELSAVSRHLRWESFESRILSGTPSVERIRGRPAIDLFVAPGGTRIGGRFPTDKAFAIANPLAELSIIAVKIADSLVIEVSTGNAELYREFYTFCCTVADKIQIDGSSVESALVETLRSWSALIRKRDLLSDSAQVGLIGELLFLGRAAQSIGWRAAAQAWQGKSNNPEEHDFVLETVDVEAKTTQNEGRIHTISSLMQLVPKQDRALVIISLQLTPGAGKGSHSLSSLVASTLSSAIGDSREAADLIRDRLKDQGWRDSDAPEYMARFHLRTRMAAIPVDVHCPAIVPATLSQLPPELGVRIGRVNYEVDLDGLGVLDGTSKFEKFIFQKRVAKR